MPVITISRGSYSRGKEIAEKLSKKLGYECISRDILIEASKNFNVPEVKLIRALHDAPSILDRFTYGRERYVAYIRKALLEWALKDNLIYHGLSGHFFLRDVPHVLKVLIFANMEDRIKEEMRREKITEKAARYILKKDDVERRKWGLSLYGIDTHDPNLYDVVLHIDNLKVDDAVDILSDMVKRPCFQTTPESVQILSDLCLGARVQATLVEDFPQVDTQATNGVVYIFIKASVLNRSYVEGKVRDLLEGTEGIKDIKLHLIPSRTPD